VTALQTVVMGLVIVFVDVPPDGFDWVADPLGWLLVVLGLAPLKAALPNHTGLTVTAWICLAFAVVSWPEGSPATLSPELGWLFSIPTLAWCFLVSDAVADATEGRLRLVMLLLRNAFVVVTPLPGLVYLAGADWLSVPAEVLILVANVLLLVALWAASSRPGLAEEDSGATRAERRANRDARSRTHDVPAPDHRPRAKTVGFSAEEAKRRARARREAASTGSSSPRATTGPGSSTQPPTKQPASKKPASKEHASKGDGEADGPDDGHTVTGAEVLEKVRRRRRAREQGGSRSE
jgi:hypothetical protein